MNIASSTNRSDHITIEAANIGTEITNITSHHLPKYLDLISKYPLAFCGLFYVLTLTLYGALAAIFGSFHSTADRVGFIDAYETFPGQVVIAGSMYYYLSFPALIGRTFQKLYENGVFRNKQLQVSSRIVRFYASPFRRGLPLVLMAIYGGLVILFEVTGLFVFEAWQTVNILTYAVWFISIMPGWFALAAVLVDVSLSVYLIHCVLHDNEVIVRRLHPDRAGGFGSLGTYSLRIGYLALIYGCWLAAAVVQAIVEQEFAPGAAMTGFGYAVVVPILFFLPIYSPHRVMVAFRNRLMSETAQKYSAHHQAIHTEIPESVKEFEQKIAYLNELQALQKHDASYPVWPFNFRIRAAVAFNSLAPAVPTVIGLLIDALK